MENQSKSKETNDLLDSTQQAIPAKPSTVTNLSALFQSYLNRNRQPPAGLDFNTTIAAKQWVQLQDPPGYSEQPELINLKKGGKSWNTPYLNRLKLNLRKFMSLSEQDQQFIVDAKNNHQTTWRGESMAMFKSLIEQCTKMG